MSLPDRAQRFRVALARWPIPAAAALTGSLMILAGPFLARLPGPIGWVFDNLGHFRILGLELAAVSVLLARRHPAIYRAAALIAVFHGAGILEYSTGEPPRGDPEIRIAYANIGWPQNRQADLLAEWIAREDADVVVLTEFDHEGAVALAPVLTKYPWSRAQMRTDRFGLGIFSKRPMIKAEIIPLDNRGISAACARLETPSIEIWLAHPTAPNDQEQRRLRDEHIHALARRIAARDRPVLVVGDLNTTERNRNFSELIDAGLVDSRRGRGWLPSWPAIPLNKRGWWNWILAIHFAIPLDHVLASGEVEVVERSIARPFGSDHLPLVAGLKITN